MRKISLFLTRLAVRLDKTLARVLFLILLVMAVLTFGQVVTRYLFGFSPVWGEELCRYLFIWLIFLALPSVLFHAGMTSFDLLLLRLAGRKNALRALSLAVALGEALFLWLLCRGGYPLMLRQWGQTAAALPVPMSLVYAVVPLGAALSLFIILERTCHTFGGGEEG